MNIKFTKDYFSDLYSYITKIRDNEDPEFHHLMVYMLKDCMNFYNHSRFNSRHSQEYNDLVITIAKYEKELEEAGFTVEIERDGKGKLIRADVSWKE